MVGLDVAPFEVVHVRIAQPAETAEQKNVPYPFEILLGLGYLVVFQSVQFLPCEEYYFFGCVFQLGLEAVISHVLIVPFLETPPQEPFQEGYLLAYGAITHIFLVTQEVHIVIQTVLGERIKGKFIPELFQVVLYRSEFFVGCVCPVVLFPAFPYKLLERLPKADFRSFGPVFRTGEASDIEVVNDNIQRMVEKYMPTEHNGWKLELSVIPLATKHQTSSETTKRLVIYGFLGFSIFFVAIMNYMLIVIATLGRRAKSVGVHKCNGANNGNIFSMFMMETGIIVLVSILVCAFIIFNARDLIEDLLSVRLASLFTWGTLWVPLLVVVLLFLLAGVLPGRIFSHIPVTQVFRRYTDGKKGWKRSLLFIQFTGVSFVLGLLLVTLMQYSHLMNRDMGINTAGLVEAESWLDIEIVPHMRDEIRRQPMVESVATASHSVLGQYWTKGLMGSDGKRIGVLNMNYVDFNYPDVVGITIIEGKPMTHAKDLLVNEEIVRLKKWTDGAVGKPFDEIKEGTIVGVFRDVRNQSFYQAQQPIVLIGGNAFNHTFNVRLKEPYDENLKRLNEFMDKTFPQVALTFHTVDDMLSEIYKDVYRFRNSVLITSGFILLIVIMGLIGYVNDETQRRSKEIAIRKVNGAEASNILRLLVCDILYVSIPSILLGIVIAYFIGKAWLEQFAEQVDLNPLLFLATALVVAIIIVACVVLKAWHIANENPVNSIKSE